MTGHDEGVVGIDIGGTNIRAALFDGGEPLRTLTRSSRLSPADTEQPAAVMLDLLGALCGGDLACLRAVGIAATGPVDRTSGLIDNPFTLPDWSGIPWADELEAELGVPIVMENDAMAAAIGELAAGAGVGAGTLCMVTLGTGIGVAVVSAAQGPYRGAEGFHPEAGHIPIGGSAELCYCGEVGCWEEQCGGNGIRTYWTSADGSIDWPSYGATLRRGLRTLSRVYAPDRLVIGGGISASYDEFMATVSPQLTEPDPMGPRAPLIICRATLEDPGVYGAAQLARDAVTPSKGKA